MAEFAGFTNDQMFKLAQIKGYSGNNNIDDINKFIMANEPARTYVTNMHSQATTLVGRQRRGFAPGGLTDAQINAMTPEEAATMVDQLGGANIKWDGTTHGDYSNLDSFKTYSGWENVLGGFDTWKKVAEKAGLGQQNITSSNKNITSGGLEYDSSLFQYTDDMAQANNTANTASTATTTNTSTDGATNTGTVGFNYGELATGTPVNKIVVPKGDESLIDTDTGKIDSNLNKPDIGKIGTPDKVSETVDLTAAQIEDKDIEKVADKISENLKDVDAAKGTVSDESLVDAETMDAKDLSALDLKAAKIDEAQKVGDIEERKLEEGELIESAYDQDKVDKLLAETKESFVTATPSEQAKVKGQLDLLMKDFEDGSTPSWAAGAMRTALAAMNARGLSASSMAGQAIVQAAMESALPIAKADAETIAEFELEGLRNEQAAVILAAKQRADMLGIEFDQEFQAKVKNAEAIQHIADKNYDTSVQVALENSRLANDVDIANLSAENAKVIADAAAMTQIEVANLTNKQQAQIANAKAFLSMDIANLTNEQAMLEFKAQAKIDATFNDQAAINLANQINVQEKNKVDQAMANIQATMKRFNAEQSNAMKTVQFQEDATLTKFFASLTEAREQFNASNEITISTANAKWYQDVTTTNNAAMNNANMNDANNATSLTKTQLEHENQAARDLMNWVFTADQNELQRAASILIAQMDADAKAAKESGSFFQTIWNAITGMA